MADKKNTAPAVQLTQMSVDAFKEAMNIASLEVRQSPKTGKWFATADNGMVFRCHQATKWQLKPGIVVLVPDGDLGEACLIPNNLGAKVVASY